MDDRRTTGMATDPRDTVPAGGLREVVASYPNYKEAQRAVDFLSDQRFDVTTISIVAEGITFVEQITGRLNWGKALLNGLTSGALIGAFIGFIFGIFNFFAPLTSALSLAFYGLIFGAVLGAVIGLIGYAFSGGERDFTSVSGMRASRYDVTADPSVAAEARNVLSRMA
ncbi:MAG TPA: general stress protein [Trueperaceae bacterium]